MENSDNNPGGEVFEGDEGPAELERSQPTSATASRRSPNAYLAAQRRDNRHPRRSGFLAAGAIGAGAGAGAYWLRHQDTWDNPEFRESVSDICHKFLNLLLGTASA